MSISIEEFKQEVINDYRQATLGKMTRLFANRYPNNLYITNDCDLSQIVIAKHICNNDLYISPNLNLAFELSTNKISTKQFLDNLRSSNTLNREFINYWSIMDSEFINNNEGRIALICADIHFATEGKFFEAIYQVVMQQLPVAFIVFNNNEQHSNVCLNKLYNGFSFLRNSSGQSLTIQMVNDGDYVGLCKIIEQQLSTTRVQRNPSLTIIDSCSNSTELFYNWLINRHIASANQLQEINDNCRL